MQRFAELYRALDGGTDPGDGVAALVRYFGQAPPEDAAWALYFLAGGKPHGGRLPAAQLRAAACRQAGIDDWLFEACLAAVGDLAETIACVLPPPQRRSDAGLATWIQEVLLPLRALTPPQQLERVCAAWAELDAAGRFFFVRLIGGGFRAGVGRLLVQRAVAAHAGLDGPRVALRMKGWTDARAAPSAAQWLELVAAPDSAPPPGLPFPFCLAQELASGPQALGPVADWLVEWLYGGLRAQVVKRHGQVWVWSRDEELLGEQLPEVVQAAAGWPDGTVVDGQLLVWPEGAADPAGLAALLRRIGRSRPTKALRTQFPVCLLACELLENGGIDQRGRPQQARRDALEAFAAGRALRIPARLQAADWAACAALRAAGRGRGVEGLMLKHLQAHYGAGRTPGDGAWWEWKLDPLTVRAVLIYAQAGAGPRAGSRTDYTFAVWSRPPADAAEAEAVVQAIARGEPARAGALQLLPIAKACTGLGDEELAAVERVVRATTMAKFGPVRSLRPSLVFEIGFDGLAASARHKSGLALRLPRMLRLLADKPLHEADALPTLRALATGPGTPGAAP